ncbi:MAG: Transposase [Parcubacteria group bacterium GW2011_GWC1_45_13]|nr:MAG: Transposase [Parcubacteria group bacterium GW2011_GWC1_45_13]
MHEQCTNSGLVALSGNDSRILGFLLKHACCFVGQREGKLIITKSMQTIHRSQTLFVGVDVHKDTHTAVALSPFGKKIFEMTIGNEAEDFISLVEKTKVEAEKSGLVPSFGLDSLDAQGVAEVMIQKIDTLPVYTLTEEAQEAKQIRELSLEREWLVKERSRLKNQLHILLHRIHNTGYRAKFKDPFSKKALRYWSRSIPKNTDAILAQRTKRALRRILDLREEIQEIEEELETMMKENKQTLSTASGCGTVIAAEMIGEIGDIARFHSPGALAKYAGCAPREHSSGKTIRWRKTKSGNRRLNRSFHRMALSQISRSGNDAARVYFKRKISEGKTKAQALVCLRRQLVNVVWMMMGHKTEYRYPQEKVVDFFS